jgi:iron-sulfur cluster assembly protein
MIDLHPEAAEQIKVIGQREGFPESFGLRFGLKDGGCSGYFYLLDFEQQPDDDDMVHEEFGVRVFIHPLHLPFLAGSTIKYKSDLFESGFYVDNPNVERACGCGESVGF